MIIHDIFFSAYLMKEVFLLYCMVHKYLIKYYLYLGVRGERVGPPAPAFSIAYNHWWDSLQIWHIHEVALGKISEYGIMTFQ